ncbi:hypothetical protein MTO96_024091 [Rhipicephalus appendiculatus]
MAALKSPKPAANHRAKRRRPLLELRKPGLQSQQRRQAKGPLRSAASLRSLRGRPQPRNHLEARKTLATKSPLSGSPKDVTGSSGRAKSGTRAEVTTAASKANSDVTSLSTAPDRLKEARKDSSKATKNEAAMTKQPEGKAGQGASMSTGTGAAYGRR